MSRVFIIAGEASGDLHASNLMKAMREIEPDVEFTCFGGDLMESAGGRVLRHYRDMAYMGIIPVITHLGKILNNMKECRKAVKEANPDAVVLVDYPSFNLKIAQFVKEQMPGVPVYYYISPKLWAWKEFRLKSIKKYVDKVFSILPFEVKWFGERGYKVDYVGNPSVDSVESREHKGESLFEFCSRNGLQEKPIIALLSGSRMAEINSSLPKMIEATKDFPDYQILVAGAPSIDKSVYDKIIGGNSNVKVLYNETYQILQNSTAAVVCSGTATLETALIGTPQTVVYHIGGGKIIHKILRTFIHVDQVSLVNLIADRIMVKELIIEDFTVEKVKAEVKRLLMPEVQSSMRADYNNLREIIGGVGASKRAAEKILNLIKK